MDEFDLVWISSVLSLVWCSLELSGLVWFGIDEFGLMEMSLV